MGSSGGPWFEDGCPTRGQGTATAVYQSEVLSKIKWVVWQFITCPPDNTGEPTLSRWALLGIPPKPPMVFDVPGLLSTPDGVPLEWVAPWENPHKMVVEEEKRL